MPYAPLAIATLFTAILWWMYRTHHRETMIGRSHLMDDCLALLQDPKLSRNEAGYAQLQGLYQGFPVRLALEEDHLGLRKIPSLWLHLSVEEKDKPVRGTLDMLMRPQNTEFYSPSWEWEGHVAPLPGWPEHAIYRTQGVHPDLHRLDESVRHLFADQKAKELLLTPQRLRLTYQAKQAERGEYLLMRNASFDHQPLPRDQVSGLLEQAVGMRRNLEEQAS